MRKDLPQNLGALLLSVLLAMAGTSVLAQNAPQDTEQDQENPVNPLDPATYDISQITLGEDQGVIEELNFGQSTAMISGYLYPVSPNVKVEIAGSYGAFTMLTQGMKVRFSFLEFDDGTNLITEIIEDPAAEEF